MKCLKAWSSNHYGLVLVFFLPVITKAPNIASCCLLVPIIVLHKTRSCSTSQEMQRHLLSPFSRFSSVYERGVFCALKISDKYVYHVFSAKSSVKADRIYTKLPYRICHIARSGCVPLTYFSSILAVHTLMAKL